jgi:hypothetical protein
MPLPVLELCRRSIGRNRAARMTKADWVWFCDADYWFASSCWDAIVALPDTTGPLIFPRYVQMHCSKKLGDARIAVSQNTRGLIFAPKEEFKPVLMPRAIGGIQIVRGSVCRERGYLKDSLRWQQPAASPVFQSCSEDIFGNRWASNKYF